jgi:hypothetical protein
MRKLAIEVVFDAIKTAATVIEVSEPHRIIEAWDRQETAMPYLDPTSYQKLLAARDDMARKKRLINAGIAYSQVIRLPTHNPCYRSNQTGATRHA